MKITEFFKKNKNNNYTYIIAEACDNHFGDLTKAKKMCLLAKKAGADCVKFQHHLVKEEMLKDVPKSSNFDLTLYEFLKKYSLKLADHKKLKQYCKKINRKDYTSVFNRKRKKYYYSIRIC